MDADIDKVMSGLDRIIEAAPSYEKLFMRWQRQQWSPRTSTSPRTRASGRTRTLFTEEERKFLPFGFSQFFVAEDRVTVELLPFALAAPREGGAALPHHPDRRRGQARGLLGSLLPRGLRLDADEHRRAARSSTSYVVNEDWKTLFDGILHECAEDLRKDPTDFPRPGARGHRLHDRDRGHARPHRRAVHDQVAEGARLVPGLPRRVHRGQPRRVAPRRLRRQVPRRRDQGRPGEREDHRGRR